MVSDKKESISYPNILVISNNPFSYTSNNGKTLASFFEEYPVDKISQLYFSDEKPSHLYFNNYFSISDKEILKSIKNSKYIPGGVVDLNLNINNNISGSLDLNNLKKYNIFRLLREYMWKVSKWNNQELYNWIDGLEPDIIFFCAGDSGFAYDIVVDIKEKYKTKLVTYITDDYILPRKTISVFWWLRRNSILKKMSIAIKSSDLFITISDKMRLEYRNIFDKDSILAMNISEDMENETNKTEKNKEVRLLYAGGFHYNRYKVIGELAKIIKKINRNSKEIVKLEVYSTQNPTDQELKYINVDGASEFLGSLNSSELKKKLNECHIPVFVESFDNKSIESTRLSLSTKIPEYLSLGKPIMSIGPNNVSSMEYLSDCSLCINNIRDIEEKLTMLINDDKEKEELAKLAKAKYEKYHKKEVVNNSIINYIINISR